jgi:hypothetical protein
MLSAQILSALLIFWTFPQFSTKPVDKIVDFLGLDKLLARPVLASP